MGVINEKIYQQIKKEMCKKDDYFNKEEFNLLNSIYKTKVGKKWENIKIEHQHIVRNA